MWNNGGRLRYFKIFLLECNYINMRQVKWNEIYSIWEKNINELSSEVLWLFCHDNKIYFINQ